MLPSQTGLRDGQDDPAQPLRSEYATRAGLKSEFWSVHFVNKTRGAFPALSLKFEPQEKLSQEQRDAVKNVLSTKDQCCSVRGIAEAGKTTLQVEVHRGLDAAGHRVIAIAPTASAAKGLRAEGFKEATTVADFLQNGASRFDLHRAVVVCDEAGLQSNRQGDELLRLAQRYDTRVIFVGDACHVQAVDTWLCRHIA
jgi:ATP-dependent exoDNAse (exonuclease V) alpha subunit